MPSSKRKSYGISPDKLDEYTPRSTSKLEDYWARSERGETTEEDRLTPRLRSYLAKSSEEERKRKRRKRQRTREYRWRVRHPEAPGNSPARTRVRKYATQAERQAARRASTNRAVKKYWEWLRNEVLYQYSSGKFVCACCGWHEVNGPNQLQLDHIAGGGSRQARESGKYGVAFFMELRRKGFPPGYRVLCKACNAIMEPNAQRCVMHAGAERDGPNINTTDGPKALL